MFEPLHVPSDSSYLILSYLILSYLILSYLIFSFLFFSFLLLSFLFLSFLILSYLSRSLTDRWGTPVDFTTSFLHSSRFSRIQRRNSRFLTISSLRREPSPTRTLKWPGRNRVQITCNMSCYVPHFTKGQLSY